jgi:hypothetical protein
MCEFETYCNTLPGSPWEDRYLEEGEEMQDNLAIQIIDEEFTDSCGFTEEAGWIIDNDKAAEWALKKYSEETAEAQRYINVCDTMIMEYNKKRQKAQEQFDNKTAYLKQKLQEYFATVPHKASKTQETYKLPSGTLKKKFGGNEFIRDDEKLVEWLEKNKFSDLVKVKKTPDWKSFKELVTVNFDKVLTEDGEVVEGVTVQRKEDSFEVEI